MNRARKFGVASLIVFAVGFLAAGAADFLFPGQDPAGKAMMAGLLGFLFWGIALLLSIIAFAFSFGKQEARNFWNLLLGRGPLILVVIVLVAGFVIAINFG